MSKVRSADTEPSIQLPFVPLISSIHWYEYRPRDGHVQADITHPGNVLECVQDRIQLTDTFKLSDQQDTPVIDDDLDIASPW
jgi:hypothetical protein